MSAAAFTGTGTNPQVESSLQPFESSKKKLAEILALPSSMNPEQVTLLFNKAIKPQPDDCTCFTKVGNLSKRCVVLPVTRGLVITVLILGWATSLVSNIVTMIIDNSSQCKITRPAMILSIAAVIAAGIAAGIYGAYDNVKKDVDDEKRDKELIQKFMLALEEHQTKAKALSAAEAKIQEDHLKNETQHCLKCYDQLPDKFKEKIPPRDLWILGLLKELPQVHPLRAKFKRMISSAEAKTRADEMEKPFLMEKKVNLARPPNVKGAEPMIPSGETAAFEKLAMPGYQESNFYEEGYNPYYFYKDLIEVEMFIGAPVTYIEADGKIVDRHCQIKSAGEVIQKCIETTPPPKLDSGDV